MTSIIKAACLTGILAAGLATVATELKANPVHEGQGVTTELSANTSAITYWVNETDGWHVVTTVDTVIGQNSDTEKHAVVRFSSVLLPGQSQWVSVPFAIGERQQILHVRHLGDEIEVGLVADSG